MSFPCWLDKEFMQKCLGSLTCHPPLSILNISISYGCDTQKSYTSGLFRLKLLSQNEHNEENTLSLIMKCSKEGNLISSVTDDFFRREIYMFENVLAKVEKLLSAAGCFDNFYPNCVCSGDEPVHFLLLEDLAESCCELPRPKAGLDLQHTLLAVKTLAKYHAATAVILQNDSKIVADLKHPIIFSEAVENQYTDVLPGVTKSIANCALKWPEFPADLFQRISDLIGVIFRKIRDVAVYRSDRFNVISHGDFWNNNCLFKYVENEVESVKLLDFQTAFVSSPVFDLVYFFYSSFSHDDFDKCVDLLVCEYHKQLSATLELLDYDGIPCTLSGLKNDMKEYGAVRAYATLFVQPWVLVSESDGVDMNVATEDVDQIQKLFSNAFLNKTFRFKVSSLIENGLL